MIYQHSPYIQRREYMWNATPHAIGCICTTLTPHVVSSSTERAVHVLDDTCFVMSIKTCIVYMYNIVFNNKLTIDITTYPFHITSRTIHVTISTSTHNTGWRRLIRSPNLQIIFHKRATTYRSLLWKMTYKDKASYESSPPCTHNQIIIQRRITHNEVSSLFRLFVSTDLLFPRTQITEIFPYTYT